MILTLTLLLSVQVFADAICADGEHVFSVELIRAATGDTDGLRRYTCDVCGYSFDEVIPATGHHWGEWVTDAEPGCTEAGHRHSVCEVCGKEKNEELPALGHDYLQEITQPTCVENGTITYTCSRCGDCYAETGSPAAGHSYLPGQKQSAEAGREGWQEYVCTVCGDSYRVIIPALPEESVPPVESKDPASAVIVPSAPIEPPADVREPESAAVPFAPTEPQAEENSEPVAVIAEPADKNDGETAPEILAVGGMNTMDIVFSCGIAATTAGFSFLSAPYIKILLWGKKKKRAIDLSRRGQ